MKRYIEIVYDNSGSMNSKIGNKTKYEIAQELFEKEILPIIGLRGDHVVLRLLRKSCIEHVSSYEVLPNQKSLMLAKIKSINHDQSTPLFYTVYDAVEACRTVRASEYLIFVLTDGDDTCGVQIEDLIDKEALEKTVRFFNVLLVQLAIDSAVSPNTKNSIESPIIPSPTTERPITAPPANATSRAFESPPFFAAIVVLPLALVAILIPTFPAKAEIKAPNTKQIATLTPKNTPSKIATTATTFINILYSAARNAIAPSLIASVISATFGISIT